MRSRVGPSKRVEFKTSELCKATGILLEHRGRYYVTIQPGEPWFNGVARIGTPVYMAPEQLEGKDADQMTKDEAQCRGQVREVAQRNRNIEDQRRSVFEGERERFGQQDLYTTMDNQGYNNNVDRLMARCMEARGWAPKQQNGLASWWQRVSTFNTPIGK
jgi:hypothetical protein